MTFNYLISHVFDETLNLKVYLKQRFTWSLIPIWSENSVFGLSDQLEKNPLDLRKITGNVREMAIRNM